MRTSQLKSTKASPPRIRASDYSEKDILKNEFVITEENENAIHSLDCDISIKKLATLLR